VCEEEMGVRGGLTMKTKQTKHVMVTMEYSISLTAQYSHVWPIGSEEYIADRIACDLYKPKYKIRTYTYDPAHAQCDIAVFFRLNILNSNSFQSMSYNYYCH